MTSKKHKISFTGVENCKVTKSARISVDNLYVHEITFKCAVKSKCIPCLYKIHPTGTDGLPPNLRPELCPRSQCTEPMSGIFNTSFQNYVLTVGDGDFSFSLSIAKALLTKNKDMTIISTSHETLDVILETYPTAVFNLAALRDLNVQIYHGIDATALSSYSYFDTYKNGFDTVIWNFPCMRMDNGADAQVTEIEQNKILLKSFFTNIQPYLKPSNLNESEASPGGVIYVTHKTIEPFCWWGITDIAEDAGLFSNGSVVFDKYLYPGYTNRKVLSKKGFPLHDAQVHYALLLAIRFTSVHY